MDNSTWIGNVFGVTTVSGTTAPVIVSDTGQLGTLASSERFKKDIKADGESQRSNPGAQDQSRSITRRTLNRHAHRNLVLMAEEVEKVNPDSGACATKTGNRYTVRYDQVNAMLLNEFLKEHRKVEEQDHRLQEQEATIAQLKAAAAKQEAVNAEQQKGMQIVIARLKEQDAKIQKVNDKVGIE